jgi:hypothetical protein
MMKLNQAHTYRRNSIFQNLIFLFLQQVEESSELLYRFSAQIINYKLNDTFFQNEIRIRSVFVCLNDCKT